jgi:hypothetical protein
MINFKAILLAVSAAAGVTGFSSAVEAQYYNYPPQGYYYQQPQYVPPRIARKQEQLSERFVQKYGYVQPQPQYYGGGYYQQQQPRYVQPQYYGRRVQGYDQYGRPLYYNPKGGY